ncbi:glycoside hydrolase family 43 protein [Histidinibacterium lentulum]|uniref:Glycoside hydrolase family 43 protein n=1 Tax=Histidinibacterium lentulum TaxID=2480588 RepID=A0A3N2RA64_9RHOB|nr:glycoside hydrolase family 43 protein [Histidinibacterium lentulum]ROU04354.1 glycoside hydrolase family 43 protein [Histidinibacterium lentulum]
MIRNPILPGFNPDPSFCRVGEDYYIATSTFEWYPGVQIHHSRDLVTWTLVARPLNRAGLLDMRGNPDSCGVWAPSLSHADGRFWLVYTDVKRLDGAFKDAHNYITTCETIDGRWSDPWYVNSSGFDPSLFHDTDGRKWFVNMQWNHRGNGTGGNPAHASFDGILLQEWSPNRGLSGEITNIWPGTDRGLTEAPHLFRRDGWYYLTTAEGGTGYDHAVSMARARDIRGAYETHPNLHLMTASNDPDHPIQRTGHGQYVETPDGQVYHTFLMGRPIPGADGTGRFCPLGRETGIERCVWGEDGWLYLEGGGLLPREEVPGLAEAQPASPAASEHVFDGDSLPMEFQWLRTPEHERIFRLGDGALTLIGRESIGSWFEQALVARRQEHHVYEAETEVAFGPETYQQGAGLTTYYNRHKFHALVVTDEPGEGRALRVLSCPGDWPDAALTQFPDLARLAPGPVRLRVEIDRAVQRFSWAQGDGDWQRIGPDLDASVISDEGGRGEHGSFTGAFVGMLAYDTSGRAREARFTRFAYRPR